MAKTSPRTAASSHRCPVTAAEVDLFSPGAQERWYDAYPFLLSESPVLKLTDEGTGPGTHGYVLSKYADIMHVLKDPTRYPLFVTDDLDTDPAQAAELNPMEASNATLRPTQDLWRAYRRELTDPWVGAGAARHTDMIKATVAQLLQRWTAPEFDFVSELARPLPQIVLAHVLGFPIEDLGRLEAWGAAQVWHVIHGRGHRCLMTEAEAQDQTQGLSGFKEYVHEQIAAKRQAPAEDMISFLTQMTYQALNRKLTDYEVEGVVYSMVIGGLETTQYALAEQAQLLCDNPQLFTQLKHDRSKVRAFVEEALRLRAPTQGLSTRYTTRDEELHGVQIPKGSILHLRYGAANLDPDMFESPGNLTMDRKGVGAHLSFSAGPRMCQGNGISRLEQQLAWAAILDEIDSLNFAPGNTFEHQPGMMLGIRSLRVRVDYRR